MTNTIHQLHGDLAIQNRRGITFIMAASTYWASLGIAGILLSPGAAFTWSIWGTGILFPLSILLARMMGINIFYKNEISGLGIWANVFQLFFFPVFFISASANIHYPPIFMGVLAGSHFVFYHWLYQSRTYLVMAFVVSVSSYVLGYFYLTHAYSVVGFSNALWLALGAVSLFNENRIRQNSKS